MPALKYDAPASMRLTRTAINTLDEIAEELGVNRKSAVEIVLRLLRRVKESTSTSYTDLLLGDRLPTDR